MLNIRRDFLSAIIRRAAEAITMPMLAKNIAVNGRNVLRLLSAALRSGISGRPDISFASVFPL